MCELNSEVKIFCTTTSRPIQLAKPVAAEQEQVQEPHRVQHNDADNAPLHRDVERLVVRIADHLAAGLIGAVRGDALKQASRGDPCRGRSTAPRQRS